MDPNACLDRLIDALAESPADWNEVNAASADLANWIGRGGWTPSIDIRQMHTLLNALCEASAPLVEGEEPAPHIILGVNA